MKVICAGLSKTGTKSLARALRILGYKIYDFPEHMDLHLDEWIDIFCGDGKLADFASMYADVDGVTDLPAAFKRFGSRKYSPAFQKRRLF